MTGMIGGMIATLLLQEGIDMITLGRIYAFIDYKL
jgi:hypothetical protein